MSEVLALGRVQHIAQQLAAAALDEASAKAAALSEDAVTELRHLHSQGSKLAVDMQELLAATQAITAAVNANTAAVNSSMAAAKAAARVQALHNAISIHDKASYPTGCRLCPSSLTFEPMDDVRVRQLVMSVLWIFLRGGNSCNLLSLYSDSTQLWYGTGDDDKKTFQAGMAAFHTALAEGISSITGMPTSAKEGEDGRYTIFITPP